MKQKNKGGFVYFGLLDPKPVSDINEDILVNGEVHHIRGGIEYGPDGRYTGMKWKRRPKKEDLNETDIRRAYYSDER